MHIVIVGNGVAGNSAASTIREVNKEADIAMISQEPFPEYSPCVLSKKYISGEMERARVFIKSFKDYAKENIKTLFGQKAKRIDIGNKQVLLDIGNVSYDKLIIATGSKPMIPPIEGVDKKGIFTLKSLEDADRIHSYDGRRCVVIGAGPIGVEVSISLKKRGWEVALLELLGWVLPRAFDEMPSLIVRKIIEDHGIEVLTGERAIKFAGNGCVHSVITDRREIECDMVILVLGMRPEIELTEEAGVEIGDLGGIKVNNKMMTNVEDVYACGDCVQARDMVSGEDVLSLLWHNAKQQGDVAGYNSVGLERPYPGALNITVVDVFGAYAISFGHTMDRFKDAKPEIIEREDGQYYHRLLVADGILVGVQFVGKPENLGPLLSVMWRRDNLDMLRKILSQEDLLSRNPWCYRVYPYLKGLNCRSN